MFYLPTQDRWFISFQTIKNDPHWYTGSATANFHLLDAPAPWGPWTKVGIWNDFIDAQFKFTFSIPDKWVNSATGDFKLLWSGISSNDNFCSIGGTFNLTSPGSYAPNSYTVSSWSTYTGSQSWVREVDGGDVAFNTVLGGMIVAGAVGAREAALEWITTQHIVIGGMNGATVIQSGTVTTDQVGTNELIAHTANIKNAVVTTLKIGANQVTVPVAAYNDTYVYCNSNVSAPTSLVACTINALGESVILGFTCVTNIASAQQAIFGFYIDESLIQGNIPIGGANISDRDAQSVAFNLLTQPSSGNRNFEARAYGTNTPWISKISMTLLGCKR
jgi:hypothetical protein